jgi:hypothetical protein
MLDAPASSEDRNAKADAIDWLKDTLIAGSLEQQEVRKRAEAVGIAYRTLRRAKDSLGVRSRKGAMAGAWIWCLPEDAQTDAHTKTWTPSSEMDHFEEGQSTKEANISLLDIEEGQKSSYGHLGEHLGHLRTRSARRPTA